jgi:hypothetical protein
MSPVAGAGLVTAVGVAPVGVAPVGVRVRGAEALEPHPAARSAVATSAIPRVRSAKREGRAALPGFLDVTDPG